jgi:hypothetical protein
MSAICTESSGLQPIARGVHVEGRRCIYRGGRDIRLNHDQRIGSPAPSSTLLPLAPTWYGRSGNGSVRRPFGTFLQRFACYHRRPQHSDHRGSARVTHLPHGSFVPLLDAVNRQSCVRCAICRVDAAALSRSSRSTRHGPVRKPAPAPSKRAGLHSATSSSATTTTWCRSATWHRVPSNLATTSRTTSSPACNARWTAPRVRGTPRARDVAEDRRRCEPLYPDTRRD